MLVTFPLFPASARPAGPSCTTTHIACRSRHATALARAVCLLGLLLLAGSANASMTDNEIDCPTLRAEAKKMRAQRDHERFRALVTSVANMKCNGMEPVPGSPRR